jgi:hypothetical protein
MVIRGITSQYSATYWYLGVKVVVDERGCNCTRCNPSGKCEHTDAVRSRLLEEASQGWGKRNRKRKHDETTG